jgi:hypothetical protein
MAKIKSTSRGLNTHNTLFLRPHDGEQDTCITTTGNISIDQENTNIWIKPGIYGFVDIDGVRLADKKLWADAIITNFSIPTTEINGITGEIFRLNSLSGMDGWHGVKDDGVAGLRIDRGSWEHQYFVWDDSDDFFKIGPLDNLKYLAAWNVAPVENSVLYVGEEGWVDQSPNFTWTESAHVLGITGTIDLTGEFDLLGDMNVVGQSQFDGDIDITGTVNISGDAYKNGSPLLNLIELDERYLEHIVDEVIDGEKTFNGAVIFNDTITANADIDVNANVDVTGNVSMSGNADLLGNLDMVGDVDLIGDMTLTGNVDITGNATKNGYPLLNLQELDERYLEHVANEEIDGDKVFKGEVTFEDDVTVNANVSISGASQFDGVATFETDVNVDGDVCISGALKVQGQTTFQNDVSIAQDLFVDGESHFVDEATFSADISAKANVHVDGYTTGMDSNLPNSYVTHAKLAAISASANDADEINYDNPSFSQYPTVADALNALLYVAPDITSWSKVGVGGTYEVGETDIITGFNWATNKPLNGTSPTVEVDRTSPSPAVDDIVIVTIGDFTGASSGALTYSDTLSAPSSAAGTYTYKLTVTEIDPDGATQTDSASTSVNFRWKRYWGTSSLTSLNNSQVLNLSNSELATSNSRAFTVNPSAEYIYFVSPFDSGGASFVVGGLSVTFNVSSIMGFVNDSGGTTTYYVYRSQNLQNGTGIGVEVS